MYVDYSQVRVRQNALEHELSRAYEKDQLLFLSGKGSNLVAGRAFDRLGDGLIHLGEKLKDANTARPKTWVVTSDCD
jgi:hypothetical protein